MYSIIYSIGCDEGQGRAMLAEYQAAVLPAVRDSEHHVGHHMVEIGTEKWILVSNYTSGDSAEAARDMVAGLVAEMTEKFGMQLEVLGQGIVYQQAE